MSTPEKGALSGITVLDLSRLLPGPFCSMILADHGARVIAVEDKRYEAEDFFVTTVMRNKEHMTLNLKAAEGKDIFFRLAEKADVIIEGFRPGVVQRLGVDYERIRNVNPRIVYCSISGYGQTGPLKDRAGHDVNYLAHSGVLDLLGEPDRPPSIPGIQIADMAGGGLQAAVGILLALYAREKSGMGQYIDISMSDGALSLLNLQLYLQQRSGEPPLRGNNRLSHRYACYNTYETGDGKYIALGAVENRFWKRLCDSLGATQYGKLQYDEDRREEIIAFMRKKFLEKTQAQWEEFLSGVDCCWAPVRTMAEVIREPVFQERKMVVTLISEDGSEEVHLGTPIIMSKSPAAVRKRPVRFGGDTPAILRELQFTEAQIRSLAKKGIV